MPDAHLLFLGAGLFCILGEELGVVVPGQLVFVIRRSQDGLLKVTALLAVHYLARISEPASLIVLAVIGTFVTDENP
jgi:hypothetical protein